MRIKTLFSLTLYYVRPRMIYEQIKKQAIEAVPFAKLTGVLAIEAGRGTSLAQLTQRPEISNHVGTLHAAALYALGEAASGLAMAGALAPVILSVRPVASEAQIKYLAPARGTISARGAVRGDPDIMVKELSAAGKLRFEVEVQLSDEAGNAVSEIVVEWHARLKQ